LQVFKGIQGVHAFKLYRECRVCFEERLVAVEREKHKLTARLSKGLVKQGLDLEIKRQLDDSLWLCLIVLEEACQAEHRFFAHNLDGITTVLDDVGHQATVRDYQ